MSTDAIGQAAGISGPGVYRHFASKADLLMTLCEEAMDHLIGGAERIVGATPLPHRALAALVALHVDFAVRERRVLAVYLREQRELPAQEYCGLRARQRQYEAIWCGVLGACADLPDAEVLAMVKLLLSMLNGTAHVGEGVPRARLVELLELSAAGVLGAAGVGSLVEEGWVG
ncbi:TetR/AcrR family transcriptional regulator [Pseudonocardia sp. WMMC193]|uniref:TetR/AcrR family transcriptional regulator n=1 Tax=Pseudonocardia sp. WMMC193 TaxID=2911965 RepID=UPI001F231035|nr:TetR/AcrR family transcriptional regulator [Pseudonocardia sp. WMMC193]